MADSDKEIQSAIDTVVASLPDPEVDADTLRGLMGAILGLLERRGVPTDVTGVLGLSTHIAGFVSRFKSSVEVDYPTGFENQIPEEDLLIAQEVAGLISDLAGATPPRPEIALIGTHIAAMRLRAGCR